MRIPRNPFQLRVAERLESDDIFLRWFQPATLGVFEGRDPWSTMLVLRSAQGGGKTSLLRVFTPECLRTIAESSVPSVRAIAQAIEPLGVVHEDKPTLLSAYISCKTPYSTISRLQTTIAEPLHLFYALLDARISILAIKGALALRGLSLRDDLDRIDLEWPEDVVNPLCEHESASGLLEWAKRTEREIWRAVDRGNLELVQELGHARPYAFEAFTKKVIKIDGETVAERVLVMLDDLHRLAETQRKSILELGITSRPNVAIWGAERMYVMQNAEVLAPDTASTGRELSSVVFTNWWQHKNDAQTKQFFNDVASRRMADRDVHAPFQKIVSSSNDGTSKAAVHSAFEQIVRRIEERKASYAQLSSVLIPSCQGKATMSDVVAAKSLEIAVAKGLKRKGQLSLDLAGTFVGAEDKDLAEVTAAAKYQACTEFGLPLYYGDSDLIKLASWNVDQFLDLAGAIFEEVIARTILLRSEEVNAHSQDQIVKMLSKQYWESIPTRVPNGEHLQVFLGRLRDYAFKKSMEPTAPYNPGVTGFGISKENHIKLMSIDSSKDPELYQLASTISSAVAHNVLFMKADSKQGTRGETWTVFYFNRMLCPDFRLPLGLGGWWKHTKFSSLLGLLRGEKIDNVEDQTESLFEVNG